MDGGSVVFYARLTADAQGFVAAGEASFHWDFGDGATATDIAAGHDYAAPGTYTSHT